MKDKNQSQPQTPKLSKTSLINKSPEKSFKSVYCNKDVLNRILKHLSNEKKQSKKRSQKRRCFEDRSGRTIDEQVKLRCRQLPGVVQELRKALMKQDWSYVTTLTMLLLHPGLKCYITIILRVNNIKVCFILLLSHPKSNFHLLQNFIRCITGYVLEEDVNKFLRILFILQKKSLKQKGKGKYIRKTSDYKVTRDCDFDNF